MIFFVFQTEILHRSSLVRRVRSIDVLHLVAWVGTICDLHICTENAAFVWYCDFFVVACWHFYL